MKISTILDNIDSGRMVLPEFQRGMSGIGSKLEAYSSPCFGDIPSADCWCGSRSPRLLLTAAASNYPLEP